MRIALFSECYRPVTNGVVTALVTLRETLRAQGHRVYVFAPGTPQPDDDEDIFRLPELPFPRHPYHFARPFPRLHIDFGALGVQIVHCQHPFTVGRLGAEIARRYNLPMVYTAHTLYDAMAAYAKSPLVRSVGQSAARNVVRRFCAKADYVIAPSRFTREALKADGVRAKFVIVPSGIVPPAVHPEGRERTRAHLGLAAETPLLLSVGRIAPEKRVDVLLNAMALLRKAPLPAPLADFRLALVGDGQCRSELEALTAELVLKDRVFFLGTQSHATIGDWYAAGDLFVLSSPAETQGLVVIEAMAAGLPCVIADYGGTRELVAEGETGLRLPLEAEAFAHALEGLLRDPQRCRRMGENGRLRAGVYTAEAMTQGVLAVYEAALSIPRPRGAARTGLSQVRKNLKIKRRVRTKGAGSKKKTS
jgi:1,2-diacylglycerol 3-alpha-glucosyltransferase